jgi:ATP-binding cassette subfamily B multidrug efflux pump
MLKLFRALKPFRTTIIFIIVLTIIQTLAELILPTLMSNIVDIGIVNEDLPYIIRIGIVMLIVAIVGAGVSVISSYASAVVSEGFGRALRERIYTKVEGLSLSTFNNLGASSLITRTTNDVTQVQTVLQLILRVMLLAPIMCIGGVVMALSQDVSLSVVLLTVVPLLVISIVLIMLKGFPVFRSIQKRIDKLNLVIREGLTGVRVIRAFHRLKWEQERYRDANVSLRDTSILANKIMSLNLPVIMLAFNLSTVTIIWYGTGRVVDGNLQVGQLIAFTQYASMILMSVVLFSFLFGALPRAMASASRINELLAKETESTTGATDNEHAALVNNVPLSVIYRNVTYRYPGAEKPVLWDISFETKEGEVTAIIGGTGTGKSTLLNLLPRFYEQEEGSILINNVDTQEMSLSQLRSLVGIVPQKTVLFGGTISENIRYGNPDASEADIRHAAAVAQATAFIEETSDGFESTISQGGTNLSGGQKQRLSIARALARKPRIYLFDDSFSALDYKTDAKLRRELRSNITHAVVLIVAQRVRSVIDADRIIVLDEGKVAAIGTHQELLKSCSVYQEIVKSQETGEDIA